MNGSILASTFSDKEDQPSYRDILRSEIRRELVIGSITGIKDQIAEQIFNIGSVGTLQIDHSTIDRDSLIQIISDSMRDLENDRIVQENSESIKEYFKVLKNFNKSPYKVLSAGLNIPLSDVYVSLSAGTMRGSQFKEYDIKDILSEASDIKRIIIQGSPGAGKSSLLCHIALNCWENPSSIGLRLQYIPIYVRLQNLASRSESNLGDRLGKSMIESSDFNAMNLSLPRKYFEQWPKILNSQWLILLDGYDEINEKDRLSIQSWLDTLLASDLSVIISTRPTVSIPDYLRNRFGEQQFVIADLSDEQITKLAMNILGNDANTFLEQLNGRNLYKSARTPLILTVAALVYRDNHQLPLTNLDLYETFTGLYSIGEALERRISEEIPLESTFKIASQDFILMILGRLAMTMSINPAASLHREAAGYSVLEKAVAELFVNLNGFDKDYYLRLGIARRYIQVIGQRSGIFLSSGAVCSWLHQTFREFLTARNLVDPPVGDPKISANSDAAWHFVSKWEEDRWRQVILFLLQKWSRNKEDVSPLVERILTEYSYVEEDKKARATLFIVEALREGVQIASHTRKRVFGELIEIVWHRAGENYCARFFSNRDEAYSHLAKEFIKIYRQDSAALESIVELGSRLRTFAENLETRDPESFSITSTSVFFDMGELGYYDELASIACNNDMPVHIRLAALHVLSDCYSKCGNDSTEQVQLHSASPHISDDCLKIRSFKDLIEKQVLDILSYDSTEKEMDEILNSLNNIDREDKILEIIHDIDLAEVAMHVPSKLSVSSNVTLIADQNISPEIKILSLLSVLSEQRKSESIFDLEYFEEQLLAILGILKEKDESYFDSEIDHSTPYYLTDFATSNLQKYLAESSDFGLHKRLIIRRSIPKRAKDVAMSSINDADLLIEFLKDVTIESASKRSAAARLGDIWNTNMLSTEQYSIFREYIAQEYDSRSEDLQIATTAVQIDYSEENRQAAIHKLDRMLDNVGKLQWAFRVRGIINRENGRFDESLSDLDQALKLVPDDTDALLEKCRTLIELNRADDAVKIFENDPYLLLGRQDSQWIHALALMSVYRYENAINVCNEGLYGRKDGTLLAFRGICKSALSLTEHLNDALSDLNESLSDEPKYYYALYERHKVYLRLNKLQLAIADFKSYIDNVNPFATFDGFDPESILTMLKVFNGEVDEVEREIDSYLNERKSSFDFLLKAITLLIKGENRLALQLLSEAIENNLAEQMIEEFIEHGALHAKSNFILIYTLVGETAIAKSLVKTMMMAPSGRLHILNFTLPYIEFMGRTLPVKNGILDTLGYMRKELKSSLAQPDNKDTRHATLYSPRQPRHPYPIPMYCQQESIEGLHDEQRFTGEMLAIFERERSGVTSHRSVAFVRIADEFHRERIYGQCNFKKEQSDKHNFKFSEYLDILSQTNLRLMVNSMNIQYLLFSEHELRDDLKRVADQSGLIVECVLIPFTN